MSVIVSHLQENDKGKKFELLIKGSPEKIRSLCLPETIPSDYNERLVIYFILITCILGGISKMRLPYPCLRQSLPKARLPKAL